MKPAAFRLTSTALLALLIVGTLTVLALSSLELVTAQQERTQRLVEKVAADLEKANDERERAEQLARHSLRLEAHRLRLSILVDTCTVARLEHQKAPRCQGVKQRAKHLARIVRDFRERLRESSTPPPSSSSGSSSGGTVTRTTTRTATPSPHVGSSDHCPPNNPHCPKEES